MSSSDEDDFRQECLRQLEFERARILVKATKMGLFMLRLEKIGALEDDSVIMEDESLFEEGVSLMATHPEHKTKM